MEKSLEAITKGLKKFSLEVNESKTEVCLFHRSSQIEIIININGTNIKSLIAWNVLSVILDSNSQSNKSNSALFCICLIKNFFNPDELAQLITSNFFSVFCNNSEIWNIPNLSPALKQKLLSTSASTLKISTPSYVFQRTTPNK